MLLNSAVAALVAGLVIMLVSSQALHFIVERVDNSVGDELKLIETEFRTGGLEAAARHIADRVRLDTDRQHAYLLVDAFGRRHAGNLPQWPEARPDAAGWLHLNGPTLSRSVRAQTLRLPDGSRVLAGIDDHDVKELRRAIGLTTALGSLGAVLLSLASGWLISRLPLRQLRSITGTANLIIAGDLNRRVPLSGNQNEFEELAETVNALVERMTGLMQAVKSATDSIAHDLRTPLARLKQRIDTARGEYEHGEVPVAVLHGFAAELDRVLAVFGSLLRLASIESGAQRTGFRPVELPALLEYAAQFYEPLAAERGVVIVPPTPDEPVLVDGDRDLLFQAVCNLLDNAVKFSPDGARIAVELEVVPRFARIVVVDAGPGIPVSERERVFERLVRLDASRRTPGFGLGLSLVRAIARLHHGEARVEAAASGARVALELPLAGEIRPLPELLTSASPPAAISSAATPSPRSAA